MHSVIFNIVASEIDHIARHNLFDGWNSDGKLGPYWTDGAYFDYEKFAAQPAIDWCENHNMKFEILDADYAMRITFNFERAEDAVHFKTRWL